MKKLQIILLVIIVVFLANCKEDIATENQAIFNIFSILDPEVQNIFIADFSKSIALSTSEPEFLKLLRHETNKQFDFDYDVLYRFIKDKEINLASGSTQTVSELVYKNFESSKWNKISKKDFDDILQAIPNLNICIPFQYADWIPGDYNPEVAYFPVDWHKSTHDGIATFDMNGKEGWIPIFSDIENPIITIGMSERVDENGMIIVNEIGYVLEADERFLTADEAYVNATSMLKSQGLIEYPSFIQVMPDSYFEKKEEFEQTPDYYFSEEELDENTNLKSISTIPTPKILKVHPLVDKGNSLTIEWEGIPGATKYKIGIKRGSGSYRFYEKAGSDVHEMQFEDLYNNYAYTFVVQAYKNGEWSPFSRSASYTAGWRKGRGVEVLKSIYMDRACWRDISWGRSKAEFYVRIIRFNYQDEKVEYPHVALGSHQRSKVVNETYGLNQELFTWEMHDKHSPNYWIYFYEKDNSDRPIDIKLDFSYTSAVELDGVEIGKSAGVEVKYTIGRRDDPFGWVEIFNYSPDIEMSTRPNKGKCKVVITQK